MAGNIDFDPKVADAIDAELAKSYEAAKRLATSLETYAQALTECWHDESADGVVELLRTYGTMYNNVAESIPKTQARLRETKRLLIQKDQEQKARQQAELQRSAQQLQNMRDRYPDYDSLPKIGPNRRGW